MNIVITGGSGFIGTELARSLLAAGELSLRGAPAVPLTSITLVDRVPPPADLLADPRVVCVTGNLQELLSTNPAAVVNADTSLVFHLAAAVSGECEEDFDLGMNSNVALTLQLLELCRHTGTRPTLVFSSSIAGFGSHSPSGGQFIACDDTYPTPLSSYGAQKVVCETLVADYSRKGFIHGRSVRLMYVSVRPGRPNGAASGFFSNIIREPLAGRRAICPVSLDISIPISSPSRTIDGLIRAATADPTDWGAPVALNLPSISTSVMEMIEALRRVAGQSAVALIDFSRSQQVEDIIRTWPGRSSRTVR